MQHGGTAIEAKSGLMERDERNNGLDAQEPGGQSTRSSGLGRAAVERGRDSRELPVPRETIAVQKPSVAMLRVDLSGHYCRWTRTDRGCSLSRGWTKQAVHRPGCSGLGRKKKLSRSRDESGRCRLAVRCCSQGGIRG